MSHLDTKNAILWGRGTRPSFMSFHTNAMFFATNPQGLYKAVEWILGNSTKGFVWGWVIDKIMNILFLYF